MADLERRVLEAVEESVRVKTGAVRENLDRIIEAAGIIAERFQAGHKLLIFGNGGSAADAQHIAAEFVNRFRIDRPPLAAIALTTDTSILTSIGNDDSFDALFAKQIGALGRQGDVALGISTSGNSPNVLTAMEAAGEIGLYTIGFTGRAGRLADLADVTLPVASDVTARIQETHSIFGHILCDLVDRMLFPDRFISLDDPPIA
jgi:D-sedoheptulose 7-phosphate isomerase